MISISKVARAARHMVEAVQEDHAMMRHYDRKYASEQRGGETNIAADLVTRIGFQMLAAYRAMRFCVDAEIPLAPRVASRLIRHLYGSDVHWDAELAPGVVIVHGMGLAIGSQARVEPGVILFQNVTIGAGVDPVTRQSGAPTIEAGVHIGAASTLVGPITVGARSKVTANCFVRASVPPDSLVEAPIPKVSGRGGRASATRSEVEGD